MKRLLSFAVVVLVLVALSGCGKKQEMEELQPITMESLSTVTGSTPAVPDFKDQEIKVTAPVTKESLPLPPQGPYSPSANEIQTALKNAGFYTGSVDGKLGPKSKKAIEDFQSANGLKADGKVGPKTWEALGKYLSAAPIVKR
ncbi:MAG: peptidoglycan-binding domain-containing protein [Candidatus Omnitrophica bacterium]|jgi:peptidoglycan hydrolase-like protein with peptidoglycan-binding domain|nr:peptidoglycan-binding domain-containing protein [Candidatus Omnitrophota bacterium]